MLTLGHYLTVSGLLFTIGFAGVLVIVRTLSPGAGAIAQAQRRQPLDRRRLGRRRSAGDRGGAEM